MPDRYDTESATVVAARGALMDALRAIRPGERIVLDMGIAAELIRAWDAYDQAVGYDAVAAYIRSHTDAA